MPYTPVEIIAAGIVIASIIKILVMFTNRKEWVEWTEKIYKRSDIARPVMAVMAIIVGYYLLQEISIVQLFAVMGFVALVIGMELMEYPKAIKEVIKKTEKEGFDFTQHIYMLIWLALAVWAFIELFF